MDKTAQFLNNIIDWLEKRRIINLVLILGYFFFILLMHNSMVLLSVWVEKQLSLPVYNLVIAVIFLLLASVLVIVLIKRFKLNFENLKTEFIYLFATLAFMIAHSRFMFDSNIEIIHSFEYPFLAFLIFPLTKRFGATILFTLPFMLVDEWYQYIVLYPTEIDYFDLNDIMMDTYGCGLAMAVLMIIGVKGKFPVKPFWKRPEFISLVSGIVLICLAVKICFIAAYKFTACSNTWLVMNERTYPEPFMRPHPTHHIMFHVMNPLEGFIAIVLIHFFYFGLDSLRKHSA